MRFPEAQQGEGVGGGAPAKIVGHQDVAGLHVAMDNEVVVRNSHSQSYLRHYVDHFPGREFGHGLLQRLAHILHDKSNGVARDIRNHYYQYAYNVLVMQQLGKAPA